jgi:hypothetical protein
MAKWDYQQVYVGMNKGSIRAWRAWDDTEADGQEWTWDTVLRTNGEQGWEMVTAVPVPPRNPPADTAGLLVFYKRPTGNS